MDYHRLVRGIELLNIADAADTMASSDPTKLSPAQLRTIEDLI
jgi:hypothetical protein